MTLDNNQPTALEALPEGFNLVWECSVCAEVLAHLEGCKNDGKHPDEIVEAIEAALNAAPKCGYCDPVGSGTNPVYSDGPPWHTVGTKECSRCGGTGKPAATPPTEPEKVCGCGDHFKGDGDKCSVCEMPEFQPPTEPLSCVCGHDSHTETCKRPVSSAAGWTCGCPIKFQPTTEAVRGFCVDCVHAGDHHDENGKCGMSRCDCKGYMDANLPIDDCQPSTDNGEGK